MAGPSSRGGAGGKQPSAGANGPGGPKPGSDNTAAAGKPAGKTSGGGQAAGQENQKQGKGKSKGKARTGAGSAKKLPTPTPKPGAKAKKSVPSLTLNPRRRLQRRAVQGAKNLGAKAGMLPQRTGNRVGSATKKTARRISQMGGQGGGKGEGQDGALAPLSGDASGGKGLAKGVGVAGAVAGAGAVIAGRTAGMALRWGRRTVRLISRIPFAKLAMFIIALLVLLVVLVMSFVDAVDDSAAAEWAQREQVGADLMGPTSTAAGAHVIADNTDIPLPFAAAFLSAAAEYDVHWSLLAGLSKQECNHGTYMGTADDPRPGCIDDPAVLPDNFDESDFFDDDGTPLTAPDGDRGPMQFLGATWRGTADNMDLDVSGPPIDEPNAADGFGVDGDGDGVADPWNVFDAVHSAAAMLVHHGDGDAEAGLSQYNPDSSTHKQNVLDHAEEYRGSVSDADIQNATALNLEFTGPGYMGDASCPPDVTPIEVVGTTALEMSDPDHAAQRVTPATQQVVSAVEECFGGPPVGGHCLRDGLSFEHPRGRACDFSVCHSCMPSSGSPEWEWGETVAHWLVANAEELEVLYIIWWDQSWNPSRGTWEPYGGCSDQSLRRGQCDFSRGHYDHVHVSVQSQPDDPEDTRCGNRSKCTENM